MPPEDAPGDDLTGIEATIDVDVNGAASLVLKFTGDRYARGKLPVSALRSLVKMQDLIKAVAKDVSVELGERQRASKYANVELVLTGEIEEGSAAIRALVVPLLVATSFTGAREQALITSTVSARVPAVAEDLAEGRRPRFTTPPRTIALYRDVADSLAPGESLVVSDPSASVGDVGDSVDGVFSKELAARLDAELDALEDRSFFLTGQFRQLEERGDEEGRMSLYGPDGLVMMPASAEQRQAAAPSVRDASLCGVRCEWAR